MRGIGDRIDAAIRRYSRALDAYENAPRGNAQADALIKAELTKAEYNAKKTVVSATYLLLKTLAFTTGAERKAEVVRQINGFVDVLVKMPESPPPDR